MKHISRWVRWILTAAWIVVIWPHAHWMISATIALYAVANELQISVDEKRWEIVKGILEALKQFTESE